MEVRQVKAKQGWQWIVSGFYLFLKAPMVWALLSFTLLLIAMTLAFLPILGQFIFTLISPVFLAGLMLGCKDLEQGNKLELPHLFVAFKKNAAPLITVGGIYLIGQVLILGVVMMIGGSIMMDMLLSGKRVDESQLMEVSSNILSALLVALALSIPLLMATWFSPLLVIFHDIPPVAAMKQSFSACLKNFIPLQLYGITLIILAFIAVLPYGMGLIILIPVIFASIYVSYKDIFLFESIVFKDSQTTPSTQEVSWLNPEGNTAQTESDMAKCAQCGVHFPRDEAVFDQDKCFCSEEHCRQYQSSSGK